MRALEERPARRPRADRADPSPAGADRRLRDRPLVRGGEYLLREGEPAAAFFVTARSPSRRSSPRAAPTTIETLHADALSAGRGWPPTSNAFDARAAARAAAGWSALHGACLRARCAEDPVLGYARLERLTLIVERLQATRMRLLETPRPGLSAPGARPLWARRAWGGDGARPTTPTPRARAGRGRWGWPASSPACSRCSTRSGDVADLASALPNVHHPGGRRRRRRAASGPGEALGVRGPFGTAWPLAHAEGGDVVDRRRRIGQRRRCARPSTS